MRFPAMMLEHWDAFRRGRTRRLAGLLWPLLQEIGEANKAWLLVEIGSMGGELAVELSRRMAWRDLLALEEDGELLECGDDAVAADPALHRLDFCRAALAGESPALPVWSGYASGAFALGALGRSAAPEALVAEVARIVRPGGAILLGEPVGGFFSGVPRELCGDAHLLDVAAASAALSGARFVTRGGFRFLLATCAG